MNTNKMNRRTFVGRCASVALAGAMLSKARAEEAKPKAAKYIDIHTHIGQTWNHTGLLTAEALLKWMDEHEVGQACVLPLVSPESSGYLITVDYVLEQTKPYRDRLIPFCCIDPRTSYTQGRHGLRYIIKKWIDAGAKGFGEHKPGVPFDHPRSQEIYTICNEMKLPLIFHLEGGKEPRNWDKPGLPAVEAMLKAFPDVKFIGHGPGWWASISGDVDEKLAGYPNKPVTPGGAIDRLMDAYPNIYGDLSAGSGNNGLARDLEFAKGFIERRQDRLMFGTDYLSPGQEVPQFTTLPKLNLSAEIQAKIFRDNARRIIGIS